MKPEDQEALDHCEHLKQLWEYPDIAFDLTLVAVRYEMGGAT